MKFSKVLAIIFTCLLAGFASQAQNSNLDYIDADAVTTFDTMALSVTNVGTEPLCLTYLFIQGSYIDAQNIIIQDDVMRLNSGQLQLMPGEVKDLKFPLHSVIDPGVTFTVFENCSPDDSRKVFSFE